MFSEVSTSVIWHNLGDAGELEQEAGKAALRTGKLAVVLLGGGHGSRLGSSEPKGCFPISPVRQASLFQLFAERLRDLQQFYQTQIPLLIWVSHDNAEATKEFWKAHDAWGLQPEFVVQPDLPLLDEQYGPLQDGDGNIVTAPNGNGSLWHTLQSQGVLERWRAMGVKIISVMPVDNALAPFADPAHVGALATGRCQALLLTTSRRSPKEAIGVVLHDEGRIAEYSELPSSAQGDEGLRRYPEGFLGITYWSMEQAVAASALSLPLHLAAKTATVNGQRIQAWKQEYFIFDALTGQPLCATRSLDRRLVFAPLKSSEGEYGVMATQAALVQAAQLRAQQCGYAHPESVREISSELWLMETADWSVREDGWAEARSCPIPRSQ